MSKQPNILCLGGGIGTVNLIRGLKNYTGTLSVVVSMADEGGSSGRLRRLYDIFPPGDIVSCMAAFAHETNPLLEKIVRYRFPGNRYGKDDNLSGHKLGNLIMVALRDVTGDFREAITLFQEIFHIPGRFLPATADPVTISAKTIDGKIVQGEERIDLGKYTGKRVLEELYLHPKDAQPAAGVLEAIADADVIITGPGDLYTTLLPVLIVPDIAQALMQSRAKRIFIINIANKPFETKGYNVTDYIEAVKKHLGVFPFDKVIINNNYTLEIPKRYHYSYVHKKPGKRLYHSVPLLTNEKNTPIQIIEEDLIDEAFPLYHSSIKLAKVVFDHI